MRVPGWLLCTSAMIAGLAIADTARATVINVVDVIPNSQSSETDQNAEPSLAVDPLNPNRMIAGTFDNSATGTPYWSSSNGGTTWSSFDNLSSVDKSLAWRQDGVAALTTTLNFTSPSTLSITTYQSGASNFGAAINTFDPGRNLDQPWIRTGPSGQTYVTYNDLSNGSGKTASIRVSSNNGSTYAAPITLETVAPTGGQDAPSVRAAINGSTVYAVFTRWGTANVIDSRQATYSDSQVVVVKSTDAGASFSTGVTAATTTGYFANKRNTPLTLGQERTGSDVAIAVDPKNPDHLVVAYGDAPSSGQLRLHVVESTDGGATWTNKFTTSSSVRSALPALSILSDGAIGMLYLSYDPSSDKLSQHLVTTTDDFATTTDNLLGTESNATPAGAFSPYLGDFYDLTSINNTFYGIFSASNADNGTDALYASTTFQRDFTGTLGTSSFQLTTASGGPVDFSIDPFVFSETLNPVPEPGTMTLLGIGIAGMASYRWRKRKQAAA